MDNARELIAYCLTMTGAYEDFPFGNDVSVMKVKDKMFALVPHDADPPSISLKCDPIEAQMLREMYEAITGGYHLNKKHWNTITLTGEVPNDRLREMIEDSYALVVQKLPKKQQLELASLD